MFKTYLATYSADGTVETVIKIPSPEDSRKRTLVVRADSKSKAEAVAKALLSLGK